MLTTAGLWLLVFVITVLETWIATWEGRADRQSTSCRDRRFSLKASYWAAAFELVLLIDIVVIVHEGVAVAAPILIGAWYGKYSALERRRAKWRARVKSPQSIESANPVEDE